MPELNPIVGGEFKDIANGNWRWLSWSNRIIRGRNRCCFQKFFES